MNRRRYEEKRAGLITSKNEISSDACHPKGSTEKLSANTYFADVSSALHKIGAKWSAVWIRYEPNLFALLLAINVIPVFGVSYFLTGDGPAHLYNANIIAQLLLKDAPAIADFFNLRYALIPNLGGHTLLTILTVLVPAALAEKLVYGLYLILLPLGFRYLVRQLNPEAVAWTLVIFPLAHNFCFYVGFQSFCIGLAMMFYSIGAYFRIQPTSKPVRYLPFGALLLLTAYFHLFTAVLVVMAIVVHTLAGVIVNNHNNYRKAIWAGVASIPTLVFCGVFILGNSSGSFEWNNSAIADQLKGIWEGAAIITLHSDEKRFTIPLNALLALGLMFGIYHQLKHPQVKASYFGVITAALCLLFYFILPDEMASGGFVSLRLLLSFLLFLALWMVLTLRKSIFALLLMLAFVIQNSIVVAYHYREASKMSDEVTEIMQVVPHIPEGSIVVPINYSPNWLHYNIGLYPGIEKPLIILDNYEAHKSHFPVRWVDGAFPDGRLGNYTSSNAPLFKLEPYERETGFRVDAVIRWKYHSGINNPSTQKTNALLDSAFARINIPSAKEVELHLRKRKEGG